MRNLSPTGEDFSEKKFLEVWVNDFQQYQGRMIVDLGEVSEDFYVREHPEALEKGRGILDTEDTEPLGGDGELTVSREDFGLDNVRGLDGQGVEGDDDDDDFVFSRPPDATDFSAYQKINNFESNSLLDTEDLDGDRLLDTDDAYLSYVFDLSDVGPRDVEPGPYGVLEVVLSGKQYDAARRAGRSVGKCEASGDPCGEVERQ